MKHQEHNHVASQLDTYLDDLLEKIPLMPRGRAFISLGWRPNPKCQQHGLACSQVGFSKEILCQRHIAEQAVHCGTGHACRHDKPAPWLRYRTYAIACLQILVKHRVRAARHLRMPSMRRAAHACSTWVHAGPSEETALKPSLAPWPRLDVASSIRVSASGMHVKLPHTSYRELEVL